MTFHQNVQEMKISEDTAAHPTCPISTDTKTGTNLKSESFYVLDTGEDYVCRTGNNAGKSVNDR